MPPVNLNPLQQLLSGLHGMVQSIMSLIPGSPFTVRLDGAATHNVTVVNSTVPVTFQAQPQPITISSSSIAFIAASTDDAQFNSSFGART